MKPALHSIAAHTAHSYSVTAHSYTATRLLQRGAGPSVGTVRGRARGAPLLRDPECDAQ